jgi:hypothetical protein
VRRTLLGLALVLANAPAWGAELELRPPQSELDVPLGPRDGPAKVRVFWVCYERDLGAAARAWLRDRAAHLDCKGAASQPKRDAEALRSALEAAAGGRALGDPKKGEVRSIETALGHEKRVSADFCYSESDVEFVVDWTGRQLAALCAEQPGD